MITNKGNNIITKYLLGQAPEYAAYIAVGVGAKPLLLSETDSTLPTQASLDFEAFRIPVISRGVVNDTISYNALTYSSVSGNVTLTTSISHSIRIGDEIEVIFNNVSRAAHNGTFIVSDVTDTTLEYYNSAVVSSNLTWSTSAPTDICSVLTIKERLIFKAQLPPDQRYLMSEIGIFPAGNNQLALGYDSKMISGFLTTEGWVRYNGADNEINLVATTIDSGAGNLNTALVGAASFINSNNSLFSYQQRQSRQESPRLFNKSLIVKGDLTAFTNDIDVPTNASCISTSEVSINLSKNSTNDYIKIALSVVDPLLTGSTTPAKLRFRIELVDTTSGTKATATQNILAIELNNSRYQIISKQIKDFSVESGFNWARISKVNIYVQTLNAGGTYSGSYVILDGIRLDNENTVNPLYGLVASSAMKNLYDDGLPVEKLENSQGYIEYRVGIGIY